MGRMFRHIVLFQIKDEFKKDIPELVANFKGMLGKVDGLLEVEAGGDEYFSDRSYDLALITLFTDRAAFEGYQTHPAHLPVKKRMHEVRSGSVACDYTI